MGTLDFPTWTDSYNGKLVRKEEKKDWRREKRISELKKYQKQTKLLQQIS